MKLHLPVSLCRALAVLFASAAFAAETVTLNTLQPSPDSYYSDTLYEVEDSNILLNGNWQPEFKNEWGATIIWESTEDGAEYTLSGSGSMGNLRQVTHEEYDTILDVTLSIQGNSTFTIESGVTLNTLDLEVRGGATVVLKGTYTQKFIEFIALENCKIDVSQARLNSTGTTYNFSPNSTIGVSTVTVTGWTSIALNGYGYDTDTPCTAYMNGNLELRGGRLGIKSEQHFHWENDPMTYRMGEILVYGNMTLAVSGNIRISGATPVLYEVGHYTEGENSEWNQVGLDRFNNGIDISAPLFTCSSINEDGLKLLEPYLYLDVYDSEYEEYSWYKPLLDKEYYAVAGGDGLVYIYLGDAGAPAIPPGAIQVGKDQEVQLGAAADSTPSTSKPVYLQPGGKADASLLTDDLLNNQVMMGTGGELVTTDQQTMTLTGSGSVNYSIVAAVSTDPAAGLVIKNGNLKLSGSTYASNAVTVESGVVTISSATTLGLDASSSEVDVEDAAKLTNFGTIAAKVTAGNGSTVLNEKIIKGDVVLGQGSVLTNNGTLEGDLTAEGKVTGSGTFADTTLYSTASLHVGNSPGYQKHTSLTLNRGATLSFSVDGIQKADAGKHGAGTYSSLKTGTLTINPGTGTVTVLVDVTMGIVAAGGDDFTLTLLDVDDIVNSNAEESDFTLEVKDTAGLLEEGTSLTYANGEMKLQGAVSKAALAALMDSNSANVANTMWASANAVQEMVRTAENQFLVGMPGQTTFWGAGLGSFMDVGGKQGFSSHAGGYAVGMQHAFTEKFRAGFAFGQMFGNFQSDDNQLKADQKALVPMLTAQYVTKTGKMSSVTVSGHVAYGMVENEADTYQAATAGHAKWDDEVLNIGARVAWNVNLGDHVTVSFFTGLNYQSVDQDSFTETFTGGEREYRDGSMSSLSVPLGITLRGIYEMEGTNIFAPELTLAYIGDVARDNPEVRTSVYGFNRVGKGTDFGRSAFTLSVGANWMFDSNWSIGAFYTLEARDEQLNQSLNAALRYSF